MSQQMGEHTVRYMTGFGNGFESEALPGALPVGRNSPQQCAYGLYAEQLSGSPFTAPRNSNERAWLYRIRPTVRHWGRFRKVDAGYWHTAPDLEWEVPIGPMRWNPVPLPETAASLIDGAIRTLTSGGDAATHAGSANHLYLITRSMQDEYFYNGDGEMLFVPQEGEIRFWTEFGIIDAEPGEIVVIPRGVKIRVELIGGPARGYLCENYGGTFTLPERGPIGANCLANPRDFLTPVAAYEEKDGPGRLYVKWGGSLWCTELAHSPLDVVAWHGNYAPYKYDLRRFSPVGPLLFDHADPSIFTTLTAPSETPGTANVDFVVFPDRWQVSENTFRPPWYHMNIMSEFMGLVYGVYDAKPQGFAPGGFSLHNAMLPHGPDAEAFEGASSAALEPVKLANTMAFMFETRFPQRVSRYAAELPQLQDDYADCWLGLEKRFTAGPGPAGDIGVKTAPDETHHPDSRTWLESAQGHPDFPIQNLPLGVFSPPPAPGGSAGPRGGIRIGDDIIDVAALADSGLPAGDALTAARTGSSAAICDYTDFYLLGTGTISGPEPTGAGSLLEITNGGPDAFTLPTGEVCAYLQDGDEIHLRARASGPGRAPVGLGDCRGVELPALTTQVEPGASW